MGLSLHFLVALFVVESIAGQPHRFVARGSDLREIYAGDAISQLLTQIGSVRLRLRVNKSMCEIAQGAFSAVLATSPRRDFTATERASVHAMERSLPNTVEGAMSVHARGVGLPRQEGAE